MSRMHMFLVLALLLIGGRSLAQVPVAESGAEYAEQLEGRPDEAERVLESLKAAVWVHDRLKSNPSTLEILGNLAELAQEGRHSEVVARGRSFAGARGATLTGREATALHTVVGLSLLEEALADPGNRYHRYAQRLREMDDPQRQDALLCLANRMLWESVAMPRWPECRWNCP